MIYCFNRLLHNLGQLICNHKIAWSLDLIACYRYRFVAVALRICACEAYDTKSLKLTDLVPLYALESCLWGLQLKLNCQ